MDTTPDMNLRDYFAAHALACLSPLANEKPSRVADLAYRLADAMLIRRKEHPVWEVKP